MTVNDKLEEEIIDDNAREPRSEARRMLRRPQALRPREQRSEARRELRRPRALRPREPRSEGRRESRRPRTLEEALMMTVLCYQQVEVVTRMF